jgi:hypothetical protein
MRLDMHSRTEVVKASYRDYQKAGKKGKRELLDRLVATTGMNRDYLAHKLANYKATESAPVKGKSGNKQKTRERGKRGGRPPVYGPAFVRVLISIWQDHGQMCGKLLVPMIRSMIDFLEGSTKPDYGITDEIRLLLLRVSPAEADLLLKPERKARRIKGISTTRSKQTPLRAQIPVQTHFERASLKPGLLAFDTVAHCGASASGHFCKTLTGTDVFSGWIEERPLLNAANRWVQEAISNIHSELPFPMIGSHYDNGMEFINGPLLHWCLERHIKATRSRPYHKNDNCYAEQKNFDAVRKTVGYFRFDTPAEYAALAEVYRYLCPLYNYWYPSFKLIDKVKLDNGRYKKVYEKSPMTPCERLLESPDISDVCKAELRRRKTLYNPVVLNCGLNEAVEKLLRINREKVYAQEVSCQEAV